MRSRLTPRLWRNLVLVGLMVALGTAGLMGAGCSSGSEPLAISYSPFESTALVWIAQDQGFFADSGLEVTFLKSETGPAALQATLEGEADIAVGIGEFPLVTKVFDDAQIRIIASMDTSELISIVARRDRGIAEAVDLKGKTIGTTKGTMAEFFLGRFLEFRGLSMADVRIVDLKTPSEWVDAVVDGDVDAIATAEPYATMAADLLGENAVVWSAHGGQLMFVLAVAEVSWLDAHPREAVKFLRALARAEEFAAQEPTRAQAIVQKALALEPASMLAVWERNQFYLTLDQSLITAMEDEARWLIANGLVAGSTMPDFSECIWERGMDEVRPYAVDLIPSGGN